jgi:hypothetical protein
MSIDGDEHPSLGIRTKADEALFAAGVWIRDRQRVRVFEGQRCVSEVDLMFPQVRSRLDAIPFVPGHDGQRMYKCASASRKKDAVSKAANAAVERPHAAVSSAARVHNEVAHMRRARVAVGRSAPTACYAPLPRACALETAMRLS